MEDLPLNVKRISEPKKSGSGVKEGYRVWIRINGERFQRFFNDNKFGGSENAKKEAVQYLNDLCLKYNIDLEKRAKKTSEIPGVSRTEYTETIDGRKTIKARWQATYQTSPGKQVVKPFSILKYGEEKAEQLAIDARKHAEDALKLGKDPFFENPKSQNSKLWRYMDFTKFVSMLENSGVYFAQVDTLGDPFEGSYSRGNEKNRKFVHSRKKETLKDIDLLISEISERRTKMMISCWHSSKHESAAMWKLYAKSNEAVCIQTTFNRLSRSLIEESNIGLVNYIDYEKHWIPEDSIYYPFMYKRKSFEHEKEVRAIIDLTDISQRDLLEANIKGYWNNVDLNYLIQRVHVSPDSPQWFHDLTKSICLKYGLNCEVIRSPLDARPIY